MEKLNAAISLTLITKEGETFEEARDRLFDLLYDGLCRTADHEVEFWIADTWEG